MEQLQHFSHEHPLSLVQLEPNRNENFVNEDEDEDKDKDIDNFLVEERHVAKCKMCKEDVYKFHLCYYSCKDCDYSLHKLCAELPKTQQNHPLHPGHNLTLSEWSQYNDPDINWKPELDSEWRCSICRINKKSFYNYHCFTCKFTMDIICATVSEQKMDHPSHHHQLQRSSRWMISYCNACGDKHQGTFYNCTTCSGFNIHLDCALLPSKLLIQQSTNMSFSHTHLLTLTYSFPFVELKAKFFCPCRVCDGSLRMYDWHYRCDKCRYYAHVECATSMRDAFMSTLLPAGFGETHKNFKNEEHPNLIQCPFPDESVNLLMSLFIKKGESTAKGKIDGENFGHKHPLILFDTYASLLSASVSLHDPTKKLELLCDGCVRPITNVPFYKCSQRHCGFILHEWCSRLPSNIQDHHNREHMLVFSPKIGDSLGLFTCDICELPCTGFAYQCMQCDYQVDIHCGFVPDLITHEAHPKHLLFITNTSDNLSTRSCKACMCLIKKPLVYHCPTCDFYLHPQCALFLPRTIRHKYDKHSLILRYGPVENHISEYFCEICEDEFNPREWFYHCNMCVVSMHTACAPIKLQCEKSTNPNLVPLFWFLNVKFGLSVESTYHPHPLTFIQGVSDDDDCVVCHKRLQHYMIFKCFPCSFRLHASCLLRVSANLVILDV